MIPRHQDSYSQFVRFAKIGFPLIAALLLIGVFVFSKSNPIRDNVIIADQKIAKLAEDQKLTNPHYSGVTKSGDAFSISAISALPNAPKPDQIDLIEPNTIIGFASGLEVKVSSKSGHLHLDKQKVTLSGSVSLETSDSYQANADAFVLNFYTGNAHSPGPVTASGPMGKISAGKMELKQDLQNKTNNNSAILRFGNGVNLIYYPKKPAE